MHQPRLFPRVFTWSYLYVFTLTLPSAATMFSAFPLQSAQHGKCSTCSESYICNVSNQGSCFQLGISRFCAAMLSAYSSVDASLPQLNCLYTIVLVVAVLSARQGKSLVRMNESMHRGIAAEN